MNRIKKMGIGKSVMKKKETIIKYLISILFLFAFFTTPEQNGVLFTKTIQ